MEAAKRGYHHGASSHWCNGAKDGRHLGDSGRHGRGRGAAGPSRRVRLQVVRAEGGVGRDDLGRAATTGTIRGLHPGVSAQHTCASCSSLTARQRRGAACRRGCQAWPGRHQHCSEAWPPVPLKYLTGNACPVPSKPKHARGEVNSSAHEHAALLLPHAALLQTSMPRLVRGHKLALGRLPCSCHMLRHHTQEKKACKGYMRPRAPRQACWRAPRRPRECPRTAAQR